MLYKSETFNTQETVKYNKKYEKCFEWNMK